MRQLEELFGLSRIVRISYRWLIVLFSDPLVQPSVAIWVQHYCAISECTGSHCISGQRVWQIEEWGRSNAGDLVRFNWWRINRLTIRLKAEWEPIMSPNKGCDRACNKTISLDSFINTSIKFRPYLWRSITVDQKFHAVQTIHVLQALCYRPETSHSYHGQALKRWNMAYSSGCLLSIGRHQLEPAALT